MSDSEVFFKYPTTPSLHFLATDFWNKKVIFNRFGGDSILICRYVGRVIVFMEIDMDVSIPFDFGTLLRVCNICLIQLFGKKECIEIIAGLF